MAVSPADFELYSRRTGAPYPRNPEEKMRMAPEVHRYAQNYARQPSALQKAVGAVGKAAQIGGALAGAYGIAKVLGPQAGAIASAVADEAVKTSDEPVLAEEPVQEQRYERRPTAVGTKSMQIGDLKRKLSDLEGPQPRSERKPVYTKENYGKPSRDLASEAENLAMTITGGGSDGNVSVYDPNEGGNIEVSSDYKPVSGWGRHRGAVEKWADDVILEKRVLEAGAPLAAGVVGKNLVDFGTIATGGEAMGNQATEAITEGLNRAGLAIADKDPTFSAVHGAVDAVSSGAQQAYETLSNLGFGGKTVGDVLHFVGTKGSNMPAVEGLGNVLEGFQHMAHTLPIEMALGLGGVAAGATAIGGARGVKKAGEVVGDVVSKGKEQLERFKRVAEGKEITVKPITEDHPQTNELGSDQTRLVPSTGIHDETIQDPWENEGIGVGAQVDSDNGGTKLDALISEVRAQLGKGPGVSTRKQAETIPYQEFERGEGMGQSEAIRSLGIGDAEDTQGLLTTEFHKTPGKVYSFYDEEKQHPLIKETSNALGGVMKGRRRDKQQGTVYIPQDKADQYYEEMDERLTQEARETDAADFLEAKLRKKQVGVDDSFTAGGLVNALKQGGREGFQDYVSRAANLERLDEEGEDAYRQKGGKYPRGWWGKGEQQQGSTEWVRSPDGRLRKKV